MRYAAIQEPHPFRAVLALAAVSLLGLAASGCFLLASTGPTPPLVVGATPTPTPSPSPSASPAPTADPCLIKAVRVSFAGGSSAQLPSIPLLGDPVKLDATPMNDSGPVPDGCQATRSAVWAVITPATCQIISSGTSTFNPFLRGLKVGGCTLTATVERVVSDPFSVEVR